MSQLITSELSHNFQSIGQFFTEKNVFSHPVFKTWWEQIPLKSQKKILEPFAGKNSIVDMLQELNYINSQFYSYDILPGRQDVEQLDTIDNFPQGFKVGITNPPFLAKNSATRNSINIKIDPYSDLYELCLKKCLDNLDYLAVIIPESFLTSIHFKNRLYAVVSLTQKKIFKYTEQPVCLALFVKKQTNNFEIYRNHEYLGDMKNFHKQELKYLQVKKIQKYQVIFHEPQGQLGFLATDATSCLKKMKMVKGDLIPDNEVNNLARLRLRILIIVNNKPMMIDNNFINQFNQFLENYREDTQDVGLTSFKGLRDDGKYRRRMSFIKLKALILHFLHFRFDNIQ